ncbi:hypothetical protein GQ55_6G050200 [Panicum hallii var. hallii]|uniref:Uncharacterized protein n=1 Tax=Panicum hallii var. hallii TaxID=1504633 RepID=A0A2T7D446_9POAL|nr:hypothetical protein GQ55_6G050200 [Panicum hallii var. hallii]
MRFTSTDTSKWKPMHLTLLGGIFIPFTGLLSRCNTLFSFGVSSPWSESNKPESSEISSEAFSGDPS